MKAVVFRGIGDIRLEDVDDPKIQDPFDAIVRITSSAICGTDLHMIRGTMAGMIPGTILGHEGIGIVEEVGESVRNIKAGDRVIIPSTIACGYCAYCRSGYFAQCDNANPHGKRAGTAFFGGPGTTGPFHGLQAEYARVPYAHVGLVKIPETVMDDDAILLSDIFPTGYFGADNAEIKDGDIVAVYGCGPVGQFSIISAFLMGASRVIAIDKVESRLEMAKKLGAEVINFNQEEPIEAILELTGGIGTDRAIDAVGVDAEHAEDGPAEKQAKALKSEFKKEVKQVAPKTNKEGDNWEPGSAPSQAQIWSVQGLAKAGTLSVIGVYPQLYNFFPMGEAMMKNLTIKAGNCNHRKYIPTLLEFVQSQVVSPSDVLSHVKPLSSVIEAYKEFDKRSEGWVKVELKTETYAEHYV
ncbi:MAG TPA: zinc-dependent alcohol dehydrogenase [Ignavibacteriales bacterium]|nr:zinc-dependent alcohol dehydrogenase [Ignavibacteriales bacterium]